MASVVFYFQVHQPFRLRRYTVFDTETTGLLPSHRHRVIEIAVVLALYFVPIMAMSLIVTGLPAT